MTDAPNILVKSEKRLLWKDPLMNEADPNNIVFGILEQQLEKAHPVHGKSLFQLAVNAQLLTRKQLEGLRDLIEAALAEIGEGRIVLPPPGTMIPHK